MNKGCSKKELYPITEQLRCKLCGNVATFPMNSMQLCEELQNVQMRLLPFSTKSLRGMAVLKSSDDECDIILLSDKLSAEELNFYCAHEMMHLFLHRSLGFRTFECMDYSQANTNSYCEWQANEGAAQLLMPYKEILKIAGEKKNLLTNRNSIISLRLDIADRFCVTEHMAKIRLESLKSEIEQHLLGTAIDDVVVTSQTYRNRAGITTKSLNEREKDLLAAEIQKVKRLRNIDIIMQK